MGLITVWTRQHENVLHELESTGRFTAKKRFVRADLQSEAPLVLEAYDWLVKRHPLSASRPADADYPIWVSYTEASKQPLLPHMVMMEFMVDESLVIPIDVKKWGDIMNYAYLPADDADAMRHSALLAQYGTSDASAYMSQFFPQIKQEIRGSWDRLFEDIEHVDVAFCYGTIWELRHSWLVDVER